MLTRQYDPVHYPVNLGYYHYWLSCKSCAKTKQIVMKIHFAMPFMKIKQGKLTNFFPANYISLMLNLE